MKALIPFVLVMIILAACKDDHEKSLVCDFKEVTDLPWLKTIITDIEKSELSQYWYISLADYNGQQVITVGNCCPMCSTITPVYRCDGTKIDNPDYSLIKNSKVVWHPANFTCTFM